jgi:hypothetical protein
LEKIKAEPKVYGNPVKLLREMTTSSGFKKSKQTKVFGSRIWGRIDLFMTRSVVG